MEITSLKVPAWQRYDGLLHGFMGQRGGKIVERLRAVTIAKRRGSGL